MWTVSVRGSFVVCGELLLPRLSGAGCVISREKPVSHLTCCSGQVEEYADCGVETSTVPFRSKCPIARACLKDSLRMCAGAQYALSPRLQFLGLKPAQSLHFYFLIFLRSIFIYFDWQKEWAEKGQTERERENRKQALYCHCGVWRGAWFHVTWGSNSQSVRSWPEPTPRVGGLTNWAT